MILECGICGTEFDMAEGHVCHILLIVPLSGYTLTHVDPYRQKNDSLKNRLEMFGATDPRL